MKPLRPISRRSFLARVGGVSALALAGCAHVPRETNPYDPLEDAEPRERNGIERGGNRENCTDGDSGNRSDPPGGGRHCRFGRTRARPPRH